MAKNKQAFHHCVLMLGSNLSYSISYLELSRHFIEILIGEITDKSHLYITEPWGKTDQSPFINQAVICKTTLSPDELLANTQQIENKLGRKRDMRWGPRTIDIDIIFYDQEIINKTDLIIPHKAISKRNFVLVPLNQICPNWVHPESGMTINTLLTNSPDTLQVQKIDDR